MNVNWKPTSRYLAKAETYGPHWAAIFAAPGQMPRYVMDGTSPEIFGSKEQAEDCARRVLIEALNKNNFHTWKGNREFMSHQQLRDSIERIDLPFTDLALTLGQRPERLAEFTKGIGEAPFMWWWALTFLQDPDLAEEAREIAFSHTTTIGREDRTGAQRNSD